MKERTAESESEKERGEREREAECREGMFPSAMRFKECRGRVRERCICAEVVQEVRGCARGVRQKAERCYNECEAAQKEVEEGSIVMRCRWCVCVCV